MTQEEVTSLVSRAAAAITSATSLEGLEAIEIQYLGRKGELTGVLRGVKDVSPEERSILGAAANRARQELERLITARRQELDTRHIAPIDVTLPGLPPDVGHLHLVTQAISDITRIFEEIGFTRIEHPEVESDWYAFGALNMPPEQPARDEWETFFMEAAPVKTAHGGERFILTPHATSGTARSLVGAKLPLRLINIQKTYRRQSDVSHAPMFHQFDGLYVDEGVTFPHLKGVFDYFVKSFFGSDRRIRFRPYHFRFVEPGFEIDINCSVCGGSGCRLCKEGWLELGGAGMLHPNVLEVAGINPKKFSGFAFGWGVERNLMMRAGLGIPDIRILYENDIRFLQQF